MLFLLVRLLHGVCYALAQAKWIEPVAGVPVAPRAREAPATDLKRRRVAATYQESWCRRQGRLDAPSAQSVDNAPYARVVAIGIRGVHHAVVPQSQSERSGVRPRTTAEVEGA